MRRPGKLLIDPQAALARLVVGSNLSSQEMEHLFGSLMDGELSDALKAALLVALAMKGESAEEVAGAAAAMRRRVVRVQARRENVVDTCGTGGDGKGTFNISTLAGLVVAAAGVPVAKHGNRAASSRCGSADLLEARGVPIDLSPVQMGRCLRRTGFAFLMAPTCHPAMRFAGPVRRELGFRTIFNLVGPLVNPAGVGCQLLGVFAAEFQRPLAEVLRNLGCRSAWVIHGEEGLDELSPRGPTRVVELKDGSLGEFRVEPRDAGLAVHSLDEIRGGSPQENAAVVERVLAGEPGAHLDAVLFNAAAALVVAGRAADLAAGVELARESVAGGAARDKLERLRRWEAA